MQKIQEWSHTLGRYFRLFGLFARFSLMQDMEYRTNFLSGIAVATGWMTIKLLYVAIVYRAGSNIGILTPDHVTLFIGTYTLMTGFYMFYYNGFTSLSDLVREGGMDMYLVKPVSSQFMLSFRYLSFSLLIPDVIGGVGLIAYGWHRAGLPTDALHILGFVLFLISGTVLTYGMFLIPHTLCFWLLSNRGLQSFAAAAWDMNNMPSAIYGKWMQRIGTFILPLFVITNFPGLFLMDRLSPLSFLWGLLVPILVCLLARAIWNKAVRDYASASS